MEPKRILISYKRWPVKRVKFVSFCFKHWFLQLLFAVVNAEACSFAVNGSSGFISFSSETNKFTHCTWIITAPSNHTVKLIFTTFRLPGYFFLFQSEIQVYDGKRTYDPVLGLFTGTRQPFLIQTSGRFMMLTLRAYCWSISCSFEGAYYTSKGKR